jgi:hypothetical protein
MEFPGSIIVDNQRLARFRHPTRHSFAEFQASSNRSGWMCAHFDFEVLSSGIIEVHSTALRMQQANGALHNQLEYGVQVQIWRRGKVARRFVQRSKFGCALLGFGKET